MVGFGFLQETHNYTHTHTHTHAPVQAARSSEHITNTPLDSGGSDSGQQELLNFYNQGSVPTFHNHDLGFSLLVSATIFLVAQEGLLTTH